MNLMDCYLTQLVLDMKHDCLVSPDCPIRENYPESNCLSGRKKEQCNSQFLVECAKEVLLSLNTSVTLG